MPAEATPPAEPNAPKVSPGVAPAAAPATPAPAPAPAPAAEPMPSILTEGEPKPGEEGDGAKPVVPDTYEFTPPEVDGKPAEVDTPALDALREVAKDAGLTQEQFQKIGEHGSRILSERLASALGDAQKAGETANIEAFRTQVTQWGAQTKADLEIGGAKLPQTLANVSRALDTFGTPAARDALINTGAANHPEVIRLLSRAGAAVADPTELVSGKPVGGKASRDPEARARAIYNNPSLYPPDAA